MTYLVDFMFVFKGRLQMKFSQYYEVDKTTYKYLMAGMEREMEIGDCISSTPCVLCLGSPIRISVIDKKEYKGNLWDLCIGIPVVKYKYIEPYVDSMVDVAMKNEILGIEPFIGFM
jgi:hypothetical protein